MATIVFGGETTGFSLAPQRPVAAKRTATIVFDETAGFSLAPQQKCAAPIVFGDSTTEFSVATQRRAVAKRTAPAPAKKAARVQAGVIVFGAAQPPLFDVASVQPAKKVQTTFVQPVVFGAPPVSRKRRDPPPRE